MSLLLVVAMASALLAGTLGGAFGYVLATRAGSNVSLIGQIDTKAAPEVNRAPESLAAVVKKVLPSLVTVRASDTREQRTGSGFIITSDGYIITNEHVVSVGAGSVFIVTFDDGSQSVATLVGTDIDSDIAVLKTDRSALTPITFGDSEKLAVGDPVLALGTPLQQDKTVTYGIISALDRARPVGGDDLGSPSAFFAAIQTDAAINHGNSGGPLIDAAGRVIGVNEQIITGGGEESAGGGSVGIGFAVPVNQARRVASEIIATGSAKRTVIGASFDQAYEGQGVRLAEVVAGGPAAKAGLKTGDVVMTFNGRLVEDVPDITAQIRKLIPGTVVVIEFKRDGARQSVQLGVVADAN